MVIYLCSTLAINFGYLSTLSGYCPSTTKPLSSYVYSILNLSIFLATPHGYACSEISAVALLKKQIRYNEPIEIGNRLTL